MEEKIGQVTLDYSCYPGEDLYLDGAEAELLSIVKNNSKDKYNEIIVQKNSWPILYHLSDIRGNIVEWLPISKEDTVLEIGAGCGAITGTLAAKAKRVDCIELSESRSLVNAWRNKDCDNITIKLGNFETVEQKLEEKYDYITLIGVFEYAANYIEGEQPYHNFLTIIKKHLKPNGKIILGKCADVFQAGIKTDRSRLRIRRAGVLLSVSGL